jgi:hypothetical protein
MNLALLFDIALPENGDGIFLRTVGAYLSKYTASHSRNLHTHRDDNLKFNTHKNISATL